MARTDSRVFVITGASSGIGAATARRAAEADVTRWEDNEALAAAVRAELHESGVRTTLVAPGAVETPFSQGV